MANELAWGFISLRNLFAQRVSELNTGIIEGAVAQSIAEHNRQINEMLDLAVSRTTLAQERFVLPGAGTLQPLDEWGNPLPVRTGAFADIGFPIQGGGTAWGTNRVSNALMTVEEANRYTVMVQTQDADWVRRHILAALLDKTAWSYDDPQVGTVSVKPLANGDTQTYLKANGALATANHYVAQAAAIADATNPFPTILSTLKAYPGNDGPYVAYVDTALQSAIEGLTGFVPINDPDILLGANSDRLADGIPPSVRAFGDEVIGKVDGMWIVTWGSMPTNYILAFAQGASSPALAMREYPDASIQGLFPENFSPDGNRQERRFIRYAGFGARNRTAALAYFVSAGDTTYDTPAAYDAPLAV